MLRSRNTRLVVVCSVDIRNLFCSPCNQSNSPLIELMWNVTHSLVGRFYFITKRYSLLARLLIIARRKGIRGERKSETTHLLAAFVNDPNWHIMCLKPTIISTHRDISCWTAPPTPVCVEIDIYLFVWCDGMRKETAELISLILTRRCSICVFLSFGYIYVFILAKKKKKKMMMTK